MGRLAAVAAVLAMVATACFGPDGQWRSFGAPGTAELDYGLLMVQRPQAGGGPISNCRLEFETPDGEFIGRINVGNPVLVNMTPPFSRVRLVAQDGTQCIATPVSESAGRKYVADRIVTEVQNFGSLLAAECAHAHTWPDPEPPLSTYGSVSWTGTDFVQDCRRFGLPRR
jgi:hypothetical protein